MGAKRQMSLTERHVASVHRTVEDAGPPPGMALNTDADYVAWVDRMMESHPALDRPTQLFAYGSLIWKPEVEHVTEQRASAIGWHRSFCFRMPRFRGTPEQPGLMMALDRGGQCNGMLHELPPGDLAPRFDALFRREFTSKPVNSMPRWITVRTSAVAQPALAFVMNRQSPLYVGSLTPEQVADVLSRSCGHWGTGAEYLRNPVEHLEQRGIHDRYLWRIQQLVAEKIEARVPA